MARFAAGEAPIEVVELPGFQRDADKLFTRAELADLIWEIAAARELGDLIPGTGGLRKLRAGTGNRGKSGGARVIYLYGGEHMPIYLIAVYSKSEAVVMTPDEKKQATALVRALKKEHAR
jgi:hypothetical protein